MTFRTSLFILPCLLAGCTRQPGAFRLVAPAGISGGTSPTLIPPETKEVAAPQAAIRVGPIPRKAICEPSPHGLTIQRKGSSGKVIVTREALAATSGAELFLWTTALENRSCIPANEAFRLAEEIIDALPMDLAKRSQLIQGRTDLKSVNSLRVVSPVFKPGTTAQTGVLAEISSVSQGANPGVLNVEVKTNPAVLGYEIDWYDFPALEGGKGYRVVPRGAEIHIGDNIEHPAAPTTNYFQFGPDARWYQLYMMTKVSSNDFDFVVFSARTSNQLQESVAAFQQNAAEFLRTADPESYKVLPHGSGINAYMRVTVHGISIDLPKESTVRQAISQSGGDPAGTRATLKIRKLHDGKLYPVHWDRTGDQILSLPLEGGEEIDW
jgi:hypothetical protein